MAVSSVASTFTVTTPLMLLPAAGAVKRTTGGVVSVGIMVPEGGPRRRSSIHARASVSGPLVSSPSTIKASVTSRPACDARSSLSWVQSDSVTAAEVAAVSCSVVSCPLLDTSTRNEALAPAEPGRKIMRRHSTSSVSVVPTRTGTVARASTVLRSGVTEANSAPLLAWPV